MVDFHVRQNVVQYIGKGLPLKLGHVHCGEFLKVMVEALVLEFFSIILFRFLLWQSIHMGLVTSLMARVFKNMHRPGRYDTGLLGDQHHSWLVCIP